MCSAQPLIEAGLLPATQYEDSSCAAARKLEWKRKVDPGMQPGASDEERKEAVKQFGFIGQLPAARGDVAGARTT